MIGIRRKVSWLIHFDPPVLQTTKSHGTFEKNENNFFVKYYFLIFKNEYEKYFHFGLSVVLWCPVFPPEA